MINNLFRAITVFSSRLAIWFTLIFFFVTSNIFATDYTITVTAAGNSNYIFNSSGLQFTDSNDPDISVNVGDKLIFDATSNTLASHPFAIVSQLNSSNGYSSSNEVSGVTRDRHYGKSDWNGVEFSVIDTGGYLPASDDVFQKEIDKQVILAIDEADVILFLVDVKDGLTGIDQSIADLLHKSSKETLLLVNKVDNSKLIDDSNEFYSLGFENLFCLSSINGSGTGEFLDFLAQKLPKEDITVSDVPKFAVVGRPNAGKSSFINSLIGKDRFIHFISTNFY